MFNATLLLRGRVPGATSAAAHIAYHKILEEQERYVYHGRVVRERGWTVLQYWFFFDYNPWRSGFHGVNDHESDWEMILVFLYEEGKSLVPAWVAFASHDFHGDDLRRRWDDQQELEVIDGHPVVYAGAGSHASYFRRGEYQAEVSLPLPPWPAGTHGHIAASLGQPAWARGRRRDALPDSVCRLRPRRWTVDRSRWRQGLEPGRDRRIDSMGFAVPWTLGSLCPRSSVR